MADRYQTEFEEVRRRYDEIEAIMADPDAVIELLEQAGFTVSRPDDPAMPESAEPAAVAGEPSDREMLEMMPKIMLEEFSHAAQVCSDATGGQVKPGIFRVCLNTAALEYARAVLDRWGRPATPPAVTTTALLHPAYEPGDGSADGAQMVEMEWWHPVMGCDSLQVVVDNARAARAAPPAPAMGEGPSTEKLIGLALGREPWATWLRSGGCLESAHCELADLMLAVLTRWGRPTALPAPAVVPVAVSERLPRPEEMTEEEEVWVECEGYAYPIADTGDHDWEPHKWILTPIDRNDIRHNRRWLPARALPLPSGEVEG